MERSFPFSGALGEADEVDGFDSPGWGGQDTGAGKVVEGSGNQAQGSEHVFDERVIEDREVADDERDFVAGKFFDEIVAVCMLAVEDGEVAPLAPSGAEALE